MFRLEFKGGAVRSETETSKFYLFAVIDKQEFIMFDAIKRGIMQRQPPHMDSAHPELEVSPNVFLSQTPHYKIFTATSGFGTPRLYYSFFFQINEESPKIVTIKPFGNIPDYYFKARGLFLTKDQIEDLCGDETIKFYKKQAYLSKAQIQAMVKVEGCTEGGVKRKVRRLIV